MTDRVPLIVVTGFLGSGKTTLIAAWLRHPGLARSAVIINEFGEIGLDHELVDSSEEDLVELTTGCVCCVMRNDLTEAVLRLNGRDRLRYDRIILETTGLADPGPIVQATMADPALRTLVRPGRVLTTVDAVTGPQTLRTHDDNRRQVALADVLLLTKTDIAGSLLSFREQLAVANPFARQIESRHGGADPMSVLAHASDAHGLPSGENRDPGHHDHRLHHHDHHHGHAVGGYAAVSLRRERPVPAVALTLFLQALSEGLGPDLLRLKGIVSIAEAPELPAVVHGVQNVFHPMTWLDAWPDGDRTSRLVVIGRGVHADWITALFEIVISEVEMRGHSGPPAGDRGDLREMPVRGGRGCLT